jgi:hypothetical protein
MCSLITSIGFDVNSDTDLLSVVRPLDYVCVLNVSYFVNLCSASHPLQQILITC